MESQLDWYRWVEKMKNKKLNIKDASLFAGLKASFSQGAGFGSMLNILELICNHGEIKDDIYQIDYSLIELAKNNLGIVRKGIDAFSELDFIEKHSIELEKTSIDDVYKLVQDKMQEASKYLLIKKNRLLLSKNKDHFKYNFINCNLDYLSRVISEVLINAIKFSNQHSEISAIITIDDEMLQISIYNIAERIDEDEDIVGIPEEYENLIFEPFFRMNKTIDEGYDTLEYGIGLTLCEKIIKKHNGQINIMNITDHSDLKQGSVTKVCCEIRMPIIDE